MLRIRRGLDIPIAGAPRLLIDTGKPVHSVAVIGFDYHGLKPTMAVQVGDRVKKGQPLFSDKKNPGVQVTAPAAGTVSAINRGERRVLQSVVIEVGDESVPDSAVQFGHCTPAELATLPPERIRETLQASGLWTALRTRPFSKVPAVDATPAHIFVTAIDTRPLAATPFPIIQVQADDFRHGLAVLSRLAHVYLCRAPGTELPGEELPDVTAEIFEGPHPAGLAGTHIHFLYPVDATRTVWTIDYQDVIAIGRLFTTGELYTDRIVALGGPVVKNPRLIRTRLGADLHELTAGELEDGDNRVISGSVLGGRTARGACAYLGRYDLQVSCLAEGHDRPLLHFLRLGRRKHSATRAFLSALFGGPGLLKLDTSTQGSPRAMVPVGSYEAVMPMDLLPTQLLRYLIIGDTEMAQQLGCLELDEEDLALCSYVCPGKYEYGPILRDNLTRIEKEG